MVSKGKKQKGSSAKSSKKLKENRSPSPTAYQQQLLDEMEDHNGFFDMLVDMIPSKLYIAGKSGDDFNPKYFKKAVLADTKKERRQASKNAKRRKLDPELQESTTAVIQKQQQQQQHVNDDDSSGEESEVNDNSNNKKKNVGSEAGAGKQNSNNNKASSKLKNAYNTEKETKKSAPSSTAANDESPPPAPSSSNASRIEALRAKLHAKIAAQRGPNNNRSSEQVSKRAARRAEKERRREQHKQNKKKMKSTHMTGDRSHRNGNGSAIVSPIADKGITADLQLVDFGRLSGLNHQDESSKTVKALQNLNKGKNLHKMLEDAQAKREKLQSLQKKQLQQLKSHNREEIESAEQGVKDILWKDTLQEANGVRIKDDPAKIKKMLARKAAKKTKSAKAWKTRTAQQMAGKNERQKIRQHNLKMRKMGGSAGANLSKKEIKDATESDGKGRRQSRAGFEGRKQNFLNSDSSSSKKKIQ